MKDKSEAELLPIYRCDRNIVQSWREDRRRSAERMAADLGVSDVAMLDALITLNQASLRGLALKLLFVQDHDSIERARQMLAEHDRTLAERLVAEAKRSQP